MKIKKFWEIIALLVAIFVIILGVIWGMEAYQHGKGGLLKADRFYTKTASSTPQLQTYAVPKAPSLQPSDHLIGSPKAKLKIFVYEDYTNVFSAELALTLDALMKNFGQQVAIVARPYLKNQADIWPALALNCAASQNKWLTMRFWLFNRVRQGQTGIPSVSDVASQLGLNAKAFNSCLTNAQKSGRIETVNQDLVTDAVQGTPTMFIGSQMIIGARPYNNYIDSNGDQVLGLKELTTQELAQASLNR